MIKLYASDKEFGFLHTSDNTEEVIYGEVCDRARLSALFPLIPEETNVVLHVNSDSKLHSIAQIPNGQNVIINDYIVDESLDIRKELKYALTVSKLKKTVKFDERLIVACYFLFGILVGLMSAKFIGVTEYINTRQARIEQVNTNLDSVRRNASKQVNGVDLYNEIHFLFNPDIVDCFGIEEDKSFECIFISKISGLQNIEMSNAIETMLREGKVITHDDEIKYIYTLTGKVK